MAKSLAYLALILFGLGCSLPSMGEEPPGYFSSRIYYNSINRGYGNKPTFTILSHDEGFDTAAAAEYAKREGVDILFLIFSGQQNALGGTSPEADEIYSRDLTGGDRIMLQEEAFWSGAFRVYTSKTFPSVASRLFDRYKDRALIVDVLNTKYDWEMSEAGKQKVFKNLYNDLLPILEAMKAKGAFRCLLCGFSRGGVMAFKFAEAVHNHFGTVAAVVTVDPVINPLSNEKSMIEKVAINDGGWRLMDPEAAHSGLFNSFTESFPVLRSIEGISYYNVFQRRALKEGKFLGKPIGAAVARARSPVDSQWPGIVPAGDKTPFDQYDTAMFSHTPEMLSKYNRWIDDIFAQHIGD